MSQNNTQSLRARRGRAFRARCEQLDQRALLSGTPSGPIQLTGYTYLQASNAPDSATTVVMAPPQPITAMPPAPTLADYPTAEPYDPAQYDGTGHHGYNPGKVVVPANFPRDQILIKPENGDGLQQVPPGNVTVPADAAYLPPGPGCNPGVVKVPDGHTIEVTYYPNGSWTWQEGPEQSGILAGLVDPSTAFPSEIGWPENPLPPSQAQPPNRQP